MPDQCFKCRFRNNFLLESFSFVNQDLKITSPGHLILIIVMANPQLRSKSKRKNVDQPNEKSSKKRKAVSGKKTTDSSITTNNTQVLGSGVNIQTDYLNKIEEDLKCNICTEILIKPTVLNCSHLFCEFCIAKWKKQQQRCPICREKISSSMRVLALDGFLDKTLELLSPEQSKARNEVISKRNRKCLVPRRSQRLKNNYRQQEEEEIPIEVWESGDFRNSISSLLLLASNLSLDY